MNAIVLPPKTFVPATFADIGLFSWCPTDPAGIVRDNYAVFNTWESERAAAGTLTLPPEPEFVRRVHGFLGPRLDLFELRGLLPRSSPNFRASLLKSARMLDSVRARDPRRPSLDAEYVPLDRQGVLKLLPVALRDLRRTMLGEEDGDEYGRFQAWMGARLGMFTLPPVAAFATAGLAIHAMYYPMGDLQKTMRSFERYEDLFLATGEDPMDPDAVARVMRAYATDRTLFTEDGASAVIDVVTRLSSTRHELTAYVADKDDLRREMDALLLPLPAGDAEFRKEFRPFTRQMQAAGAKSRKDLGATRVTDDFDLTLAMSRVRAAQARRMDRHCRRAAARLLAASPPPSGGELFPWQDELGFSYLERVVRPDGRRMPGMQRIYMRAIRESSLDPSRPRVAAVFEFVCVEPQGIACHEPWFVALYRCGTLLSPYLLDVAARERRRAVMVAGELPSLVSRPPMLALNHGMADLYAGALRAGRVLVPISSFAAAMTFAHALMRVMATTLCRVGEAMQMVYDPAGWIEVVVEGRGWPAFLAIPKGWDETSAFVLNDRTMRFLGILGAVVRIDDPYATRRAVEPALTIAKKAGAARFVFAWGGRALMADELNFMMQYLTAGFGMIRSHDLRHGGANRLFRLCGDMRLVALAMRVRGEGVGVAPRYAAQTEKQRAAAVSNFIADAVDLEELLASDDDGGREDARPS